MYCTTPRSPWQRGGDENTNGLLRQYLPRTLDFRTLNQPTSTPSPTTSTDALDRRSASTPSPALAEVLR